MSDDGSSSPRLVRDLMSVGVLTCSPTTLVVELTRILLEKDLEGAVVLDDRGHATGIVSRDDLIRVYATGDDIQGLAVEAVMQDEVPQIPPDIPLTVAAQIMQDRALRIIFLTHHAGGIEYPAAMLSYNHLLRHMAMESVADLSDLGIEADRESPLEAFIKRRDEARRQANQ